MTLETMEPTKGNAKGSYEAELNDWINHEKAAIDLIGVIGKLWFEKSIELILFRNQLVDRSASEIMNLHHYAKNIVKKVITIEETLVIAIEISKMDICPSRVDIGKLAFEWQQEGTSFKTVEDFLKNKLVEFVGKKHNITPKDVILFGLLFRNEYIFLSWIF